MNQFKWYRKTKGGCWFLIRVKRDPEIVFEWRQSSITAANESVIDEENYA